MCAAKMRKRETNRNEGNKFWWQKRRSKSEEKGNK
jgi:hypothetical protein